MGYLETINEIISSLHTTMFQITMFHVATLVTINTIFIVFGKYKLGLMTSFSLVFVWMFLAKQKFFLGLFTSIGVGWPVFVTVGVMMFSVMVFGLFLDQRA